MTNFNITPQFIFSASERELLTLSLADIVKGLFADYKSFSHALDAGIRIPENKQEPRMMHSIILYAEGLRLAHTHLELAKKLILASLFCDNDRSLEWLSLNGEIETVETLFKEIKAFEEWKAIQRQKKEEEARKTK